MNLLPKTEEVQGVERSSTSTATVTGTSASISTVEVRESGRAPESAAVVPARVASTAGSRLIAILAVALALFWLGRALEEKGQPQQAARAYEAALRLAPGLTGARARLDAIQAGAR